MARACTHPLLGKKLLVITAHPDDESYVMAGTLVANAHAGGQALLVCATRGEKGTAHLPRRIPAESLAKRRLRELQKACKALAVRQHCVCQVPDGRLQQHRGQFTQAILRASKNFGADMVVSFGPCGITGHVDHIAAGKIGRTIARKLQVPFAAAVLSPTLQRAAKHFLASRRYNPHYLSTSRFVMPNLTIRINANAKRRALQCHASQMDGGKLFTGFPKYVVQGLLHREYFRIWKS